MQFILFQRFYFYFLFRFGSLSFWHIFMALAQHRAASTSTTNRCRYKDTNTATATEMESCSCFYALGYGMFISVCIPFLMIFNYAPRFKPRCSGPSFFAHKTLHTLRRCRGWGFRCRIWALQLKLKLKQKPS